MQKTIVTLTGPSLTGKTHLAAMIRSACKASAVVTTTTRAMREGEAEGTHYYFRSREQFESLLAGGKMVEHALVDGNYYGLSKAEIEKALASSDLAVVTCEPLGAKAISAYAADAGLRCVKVFVNNPLNLLLERFLQRYKSDGMAQDAKYAKRLANMIEVEQKQWVERALSGSDRYDVLIENFDAANAQDALEAIKSLCRGRKAKASCAKR